MFYNEVMDDILIIAAFIAGLFIFLAPCTLPLVPAYLGFISGLSLPELKNKDQVHKLRSKFFINGLFFVFGFTLIFVSLGSLASWLGQSLVSYKLWLSRLGGLIIIFFGLFELGLIKINFLYQEKRIKKPTWLLAGHSFSSFLVGAIFALGWTPCIGPVLGSILLLAANSQTAGQGALLLLVFSLGLALPFLLTALLLGSILKHLRQIHKYLKIISFIGGLFLIFLGLLLLTNRFSWLVYMGFKIFSFIKYEGLINYL